MLIHCTHIYANKNIVNIVIQLKYIHVFCWLLVRSKYTSWISVIYMEWLLSAPTSSPSTAVRDTTFLARLEFQLTDNDCHRCLYGNQDRPTALSVRRQPAGLIHA